MIINGGDLTVSLIDGFTPTGGDTFDILNFDSLAGSFFDSIILPGGPTDWDTSMLQTDGSLTFLAGTLSGDFNADGDVDGDDFLAWQTGFGTPAGAQNSDGDYDNDGDVDRDDLLGWQHEFGSGTGVATAAVPEPASIALVLVMAVLGTYSRRRGISRMPC